MTTKSVKWNHTTEENKNFFSRTKQVAITPSSDLKFEVVVMVEKVMENSLCVRAVDGPSSASIS